MLVAKNAADNDHFLVLNGTLGVVVKGARSPSGRWTMSRQEDVDIW